MATTEFGSKLQQETTGCRLATFALTCRRKMDKGQIAQIAHLFSAQTDSVNAGRRSINAKHELVAPVFAVIRRAKEFLCAYSIDYPERGLRLVKLSKVQWLTEQIGGYQAELNEHLAALDEGWEQVKAEAKERLKDLYNPGDYPIIPSSSFGIQITFPAIKPDDRMLALHPEIYAAEQARISAMFTDAVNRAEAAAADELAGLLEHLVERLQPEADGKAKKLHETTVDKLGDFVKRFKGLSIGSNASLDALIEQVEDMSSGLDVKTLRKSDNSARAQLAERIKALRGKVDELVIVRPSRDMEID